MLTYYGKRIDEFQLDFENFPAKQRVFSANDIDGSDLSTDTLPIEYPTYGSAILAGMGAGVFESVEKAVEIAVKPNKVYKPSGKDYTECYERYKNLDERLWG